MSVLNILAPLVLSSFTIFGALTSNATPLSRITITISAVQNPTDSTKVPDSITTVLPDTFTPPFLGQSLRYGVDTTVSPCVDFYQYVNGDWRAKTKLDLTQPTDNVNVSIFRDTERRTQLRLQNLLDSARTLSPTTNDATLKVLGAFYSSCLTADSLERVPKTINRSKTPLRDSTRAEQCVQRTITTLSTALGQAFAKDLFASHAVTQMQELLEAVRTATIERLKRNKWMTPDERAFAIERLEKLQLRVGMHKEVIDYSSLTLTNDYLKNKTAVANFNNQRWVNSIGTNIGEQWRATLLTPNAFYLGGMGGEHAIEVPAAMFMPPFFDPKADDALNFAGIGLVIAHEIFHSIAPQLPKIKNSEMQANVEKFKALNSELGMLDGWTTDGNRTFIEDIADLGGVLVAYDAWKATLKKKGKPAPALLDGYTPDQRFFIGTGLVWRGKWKMKNMGGTHAAPFARVHLMIKNSPQFAKAFGCKEGDAMVPPAQKRVIIW